MLTTTGLLNCFKLSLKKAINVARHLCLGKIRSTKGGIKPHVLLDHDGYIPAFASITDAKTSDFTYAKTLALPPGSAVLIREKITSLPGIKRT